MFDIPISVKVLKFLRENQVRGLTKGEIADDIKEDQGCVDKALEELAEKGLVSKKTEFYSFVSTHRSEELCEKMFKLYEIVSRKPLEKFIIRGLLREVPLRMNGLLETLEREGFDREELNASLDRDIKKGYIKRIRIPKLTHAPLYDSVFTRVFFRFMKERPIELARFEKLGEYFKSRGLEVREEDYLVGLYPPELANPAREYVDREHREIRKKVLRNGSPPEWFQSLWTKPYEWWTRIDFP